MPPQKGSRRDENPPPPPWLPRQMDANLTLSLLLGGVTGCSLGLFGGGGSILAVPVLVYVTRVAPAAAVPMSLAIVGATSLTASLAHWRSGRVRGRVALAFGGAGVAAAFVGARFTHLVSGRLLMLLFAALMTLAGAWMLLGRRLVGATQARPQARWLHAVLAGAGVGAVTGFLGVGGGFLVVPALIAFAGLDMRTAVGTSLLVIAINSAAGFLGHLGDGHLDLGLIAALTAVAAVGAFAGERAARHLSVARLRQGFALFVITVGLAIATRTATGWRSHAASGSPAHSSAVSVSPGVAAT